MILPFVTWHRNKKKIGFFIVCFFLISYLELESSSLENFYHVKLQNRNKEIIEIEPKQSKAFLTFASDIAVKKDKSYRPEVKSQMFHGVKPEVLPRIINTTERDLFLKDSWDILEEMKEGKWKNLEYSFCDENFFNFDKSFILMNDVILDSSKKVSKSKGGEEITDVIGQREKDEEVIVKAGFFNLPCKTEPTLKFSMRSHFKNWFSGISIDNYQENNITTKYSFTVLIKRGDYANLYWTLTELYNTYLTVRIFDEDPKTTNVILMDAHPVGKLDPLWKMVFGNVNRIGQLEGRSFHKKLAWVTPEGPMVLGIKNIPFINDFKYAIYKKVFDVPSLRHECSNQTLNRNVTFILRKNYLAHPRNPNGKVVRKIVNEKELMEFLVERFPDIHLNAVQIDLLPIEEQIKVIYNTEILIGVHGAGLGYTLLQRSGSTMIELFPSLYKLSPNPHFQMFAYWADVHYDRWYSTNKPRQYNEWVYVDLEATYKLLKHALTRSCTH